MRAKIGELGVIGSRDHRDLVSDPDTPAGVRLKAALAVLQSIGTLQPEQIGDLDPATIGQKGYSIPSCSESPLFSTLIPN